MAGGEPLGAATPSGGGDCIGMAIGSTRRSWDSLDKFRNGCDARALDKFRADARWAGTGSADAGRHPAWSSKLYQLAGGASDFAAPLVATAATFIILVRFQPPFVCKKKRSSLDPKAEVESLSMRRVAIWCALVFCAVLFSDRVIAVSAASGDVCS